MDENNIISPESKWPKSNGMIVPKGYLEEFTSKMMDKIPQEPAVIEIPKRTLLQIIRPYTYLAAMFAGAYLMLNIFSVGSFNMNESAKMQRMLAEVVNTNTLAYVDDYIAVDDYDIYDELYNEGFEIPSNY